MRNSALIGCISERADNINTYNKPQMTYVKQKNITNCNNKYILNIISVILSPMVTTLWKTEVIMELKFWQRTSLHPFHTN